MLLKQSWDDGEILSVDENQLKTKLYEISARVKAERLEVKEIILFGSLTKNEFLPSSDIFIHEIMKGTILAS